MSKTIYYQNKQIQLGYSATLNHLIPCELWQCGLSLPALGLAGYIYTLPKEWKLSVTHLSKQLMMSKNTCRKYLKEIFTNAKACEVFNVKEVEINTYDFDEGFIAYDYASEAQELENFTSSVAKDVSVPNRKKVLIVQTQQQKYLLNMCFTMGQKVDSSDVKNAQNLSTIKRDSKESLKDSSSKRPREKAKDLASFLDLKAFNEQEQEAIRLWITYKQESSKTRLKPSQIDFQLRKIQRLKEQGQEIVAIIEKSVDMGWQGLFPVIASETKQSIKVDRHAAQSTARDDRKGAFANTARDEAVGVTPKMPKNLGGKAVLCVK